MSEIRATTISNAAGTGPATLTGQSAAKAWYNFDQYFTNTIRDSFNISTVVDGGTGILIGNFSSSMANASYSASTACGLDNSYRGIFSFDVGASNYLSTSVKGIVRQCDSPATSLDTAMSMLHIHGDLA